MDRPKPKGEKRKVVGVAMPKDVYRAICDKAVKEHRSVSNLIAHILATSVER